MFTGVVFTSDFLLKFVSVLVLLKADVREVFCIKRA